MLRGREKIRSFAQRSVWNAVSIGWSDLGMLIVDKYPVEAGAPSAIQVFGDKGIKSNILCWLWRKNYTRKPEIVYVKVIWIIFRPNGTIMDDNLMIILLFVLLDNPVLFTAIWIYFPNAPKHQPQCFCDSVWKSYCDPGPPAASNRNALTIWLYSDCKHSHIFFLTAHRFPHFACVCVCADAYAPAASSQAHNQPND